MMSECQENEPTVTTSVLLKQSVLFWLEANFVFLLAL